MEHRSSRCLHRVIVIGPPLCTAFCQQSWWEKKRAIKLLHVAVDVYEEQILARRYFLHEHPVGTSSWTDPRMTTLQKTKGVFTVLSPMCCFQPKGVNKFVYKPTKWVTNSKVLAEALGRICANNSEPPFHRHIVLVGGLAQLASAYAPELVNTVLQALRQQMLNDGWISELELKFSGPTRSESVFDVKESEVSQWADEFDNLTGARLPGEPVHAGKMEKIRWVKKIKLCKKISKSEAKRRGTAVVPIKWVVTDEGDPDRPKVRCRLVGKKLRAKTKETLLAHELFSAMPP